jgi:hypothetical protein
MNAATQGTPRLIGGIVILIVAAFLLYYLYDYLYNISSLKKKADILPNPVVSPQSSVVIYPAANQTDVNLNQLIYTGGEMAVSFWIYVTGVSDNLTSKKHIFHLATDENGGNYTLIVALGNKDNNALYVRVNDGTDRSFSLLNFMGPGTNTSTNEITAPCNIANIEYGRWVNTVIVLNNNLCDVYMDGKLSRSCVLKGQFQVANTGTKFYILKPSFGESSTREFTNWRGSLSGFSFYNYAISPDQAYRIYMAGPSGSTGNLWASIKSFFGGVSSVLPELPN